jgi:hypothetical protein
VPRPFRMLARAQGDASRAVFRTCKRSPPVRRSSQFNLGHSRLCSQLRPERTPRSIRHKPGMRDTLILPGKTAPNRRRCEETGSRGRRGGGWGLGGEWGERGETGPMYLCCC